ncbi:Excitatory amino acid transporter [Citrus sinensis]|uniref:Excitatory amino acid transporter n=1 Tax=Citrus sinensis TaxID=2711 RepID=A0ACB8NBY1_CITSI|nr:Excitatory amino acid transporter [Citrus sinensis]KAH9795397.1 Excitatory amino acid transporter [Citrus sinensis]
MAWSATMIGALLGLGTQMYSNALRKLPYMRHPWEHLLGMGLGAVFVNQLVKWDAQLQQDLDKMLEKAKAANERRYFDHKCGDFHLILSYLVFVLFLDLCLPYHMREREEVHKKFESRLASGPIGKPECSVMKMMSSGGLRGIVASPKKEVIFKFAEHKLCAVFVGTG